MGLFNFFLILNLFNFGFFNRSWNRRTECKWCLCTMPWLAFWALYCQKRPTIVSKETYYSVKRHASGVFVQSHDLHSQVFLFSKLNLSTDSPELFILFYFICFIIFFHSVNVLTFRNFFQVQAYDRVHVQILKSTLSSDFIQRCTISQKYSLCSCVPNVFLMCSHKYSL